MAAAYTSLAALKTHMGISDTNDDTALSAVATAVNSLIEDAIGFAAADGGTAIRSYDGNGSDRMFIRGGLQGITTLEVADATGGSYTTTTDYVLKPYAHERPSNWPSWYVQLTDLASVTFTAGYETVRITPATGWGFAAIPEELQRIADIMGTRMFQSRQTGETFVIGSGEFGQAIVRFLPEPEYRDVLDHYGFTLGGKRRAS